MARSKGRGRGRGVRDGGHDHVYVPEQRGSCGSRNRRNGILPHRLISNEEQGTDGKDERNDRHQLERHPPPDPHDQDLEGRLADEPAKPS